MRNFRKQATNQTPAIDFNYETHELRISGECWLEDAAKFWVPVLESLNNYLENAGKAKISVAVQLSFLNTGSFKAMVQLYRNLDEAVKKGTAVVFRWRYRKDDEMARGYGEDLAASVRSAALQITLEEEEVS